jgi:sRNA-binding carbon storage regulator CsrA
MFTVKRKVGESIVIGDVAVTVVSLATRTAELALARLDGTDLGTVTIGTKGLIDLVHGVQAVVLDVNSAQVRLGFESPANGLAHCDSTYRD